MVDLSKCELEPAFATALQRAEREFLAGNLDAAEGQLRALTQSCPSLQSLAEVTRLRANLYTIRGQLARAIEVCLEFLRRVEIDWRARPGDREVVWASRRLRKLAKRLSDEELHALPPMTDPVLGATMRVFGELIAPAQLLDRNLYHLVLLAAVRLTLEHGICVESCYPLVCVFDVFGIRYQEAELGFRLARFGAALADQQPHFGCSGRALMVFGHLVSPWMQPIPLGQPVMQRALKIALATGDLALVAYTRRALVSARLFCGESLRQVCKDAEEGLAFADGAGFELPAGALAVQKDLALRLIGRDGKNRAGDESLAEPNPLAGTRPDIAFFDYVARIQASELAGRHDAALALAESAEKLCWVGLAHPESVEHRFYAGLAHGAAHDAAPRARRRMHLESLRRQLQDLTTRCAGARANFADRLTLLAAEIARIEGRNLDAQRLYEESTRLARNAGFVQIEALASERAARFYTALGIHTVAFSYLANARDCYLRWGADAKAGQLERSNPRLRATDSVPGVPAAWEAPLHELDVDALLRASRALSGEIEIEALIRTLMRVVIEHAGAERGILFLVRNGGAEAVAEAHLGPSGIDVAVREGGYHELEFSRHIVNYVVRARASFNSAESADADVRWVDGSPQQKGGRTVHCLPMVTHAKLVGVLYLQRHVAIGAFTPARMAVLDLLAAQAAISLENAHLYSDLRRSEAFLAEGQRMSHSGSWSWDAKTGKVLWSHEHYRIFGVNPGGAVPSVKSTFRRVQAEDRAALRRTVLSAIRNRGPFTCEYRLIRSDGVRQLRVVARPELDDCGNLKSYVGTTIDMSDYRRTQEALQAAQSNLAHASRLVAIGELTSLIAHEVRQPLAAIVAEAGACRFWLTRDSPDVSEAVISAGRIARDAHRAAGVVESIRQMTRKSLPARAPVDINAVIRETLMLLTAEIRRLRVVLNVDLAVDLKPVPADGAQLQQVVLNLVMNAIEAMATIEDRARLLSLSTTAEPPGTVAVAVADAGVGLPTDTMERLCEAFFTTKPDGLGMGLTICRSIIESHGGSLEAKRNDPSGSVFRFTLPLRSSEQ